MPVYMSTNVKDAAALERARESYAHVGKIDSEEVVETMWHAETCPYRGNNGYSSSRREPCCDEHGCRPNLFVRFEFFTGAVIAERERNMSDDSDFYALVWDGEKVREVEWGTTRFWSYTNGCVVDATPETMQAALEWWRKDRLPRAIEEWERTARAFEAGKWVRINKGRTHKDKIGRYGMVVSRDLKVFGYNKQVWYSQVSLDSPDRQRVDVERIWIAEGNCEVVEYGETPYSLIEQQVNRSFPSWYYVPKEMKRAA